MLLRSLPAAVQGCLFEQTADGKVSLAASSAWNCLPKPLQGPICAHSLLISHLFCKAPGPMLESTLPTVNTF